MRGLRAWEVLGVLCVGAGIVALFVVHTFDLQLLAFALIAVGFIWLIVQPRP